MSKKKPEAPAEAGADQKKPEAPAEAGADQKKPEAPAEAGARASLVRMFRDRDGMEGDVHPDEVENYARGGWRRV